MNLNAGCVQQMSAADECPCRELDDQELCKMQYSGTKSKQAKSTIFLKEHKHL